MLGMFMIAVLATTALGAVNPTNQLQAAETDSQPVSGGVVTVTERAVAAHSAEEASSQEAFGDGRVGFWIIGILINLSVLALFLVWAVREWRKKKG